MLGVKVFSLRAARARLLNGRWLDVLVGVAAASAGLGKKSSKGHVPSSEASLILAPQSVLTENELLTRELGQTCAESSQPTCRPFRSKRPSFVRFP
mmetsp:Transcript_89434/g.123408  ORF Transcript_89434/g.123408 Transcript_89434/m.123408 type:complete len:96 (+) Transcript_89434:45-332(+)